MVLKCQSVQKEHATLQDQDRQPAGARQHRSLARSARRAEQCAARLVELLQPWDAGRHTERSIATSTGACATSLRADIKWQDAGPGGSPVRSSINVVSCASNACR